MNIKKLFTGSALLAVALTFAPAADGAMASGTVATLPVNNASLQRNGNLMTVDMHLDLGAMQLKGDKAVLITPYIVNGPDSLALPAIGLYSRNRWYQYERSGKFLGNADATSMRFTDRPSMLDYVQHVNYRPWFNGAHMAVKAQTYGCCRTLEGQEIIDLGARYREFAPSFLYQTVPDIISVDDVVKTRELSGRAYIDFPVNQTFIYPDYRNNTAELGKIIATIDSVKNDPDVIVNSIFIKGTASPEGPYENNVRLAKGRTEALKDYVEKLYNFPKGFIKTDYEPVDWDGLREYLQSPSCHLEHRYQILDIVNSGLEPYARNQKIKTTYAAEYKFLLDNIYPTLRHSDYRIEYTIRKFTTVEEIASVIRTQPYKLTLNEMLFLAQSYEPGSDDFNDVFEIAVRMFPDEPLANLNVATSAMQRGDLVSAARYLPKAGDSAEAQYARANYAFLTGDYTEADRLYKEAAMTLPEAADAYERFSEAGYN